MLSNNFIQKAMLKHQNKYTYCLVNYVSSREKVIITCPVHGPFKQRPSDHLQGQGCKLCAREKNKAALTKRPQDFIQKAEKKHNFTYDYTKTSYTKSTEQVTITCYTHGDFTQYPYVHLRGAGCPKCGNQKAKAKNTKSAASFISKANNIHNNFYDYTQTDYTNAKTKVVITCPVHGNFSQLPSHHLNGSGCSKCAPSGFNPAKPATLYYLSINNGQAYKIGITNRSVNERFSIKDLQKIEVLFTKEFVQGYHAQNIEKLILLTFDKYKYQKNPLLENGNTELFSTNIQEDLNSIIDTYLGNNYE